MSFLEANQRVRAMRGPMVNSASEAAIPNLGGGVCVPNTSQSGFPE
jgi:hypothetical protein